jgi:hypothetical protein
MRLKTYFWSAVAAVFLSAVALPSGCQDASGGPGWQRVDAVAFSVAAPPGWRFHQLSGADSYVGEFLGGDIVLRFDFGSHSNPFQDVKEPAYLVLYKHIGGRRARVVSPKTPGHGITGVYFSKTFDSNKLSMFAKDLNSGQQELVLKIFDTIRFGRTVPPIVPPPPPANGNGQ